MMNHLKLQHRLEHLEQKHRELDKEITELYNNYDSDDHVHQLKKERLHVKEEINNLKAQLKAA